MKHVAIFAALLVLSAPAFAGESALAQLRVMVGDSQPPVLPRPARSLLGKPCNWGKYRGTCFYDDQGQQVYWILREWNDNGPIGAASVGYAYVFAKQNEYNQWAVQQPKRRPDLYPSTLALSDLVEPGWNGDVYTLPLWIPPFGQVDVVTLKIPLFKGWARTVEAWDTWQSDCDELRKDDPTESPAADICSKKVRDFDPDNLPGDSYLEDELGQRAKWIAAARADLARYDALLKEGLKVTPNSDNLPPPVMQGLKEAAADVDADLDQAEKLGRLFEEHLGI